MLNIRVQNLKDTRNVQNDTIQKYQQKIENLKILQNNIIIRINNINNKFEALKGHSEKLYSILLRSKTRVSKTERDYHKQLKDWNKSIKRMVDTTDNLASAMIRIKASSEQSSSSSSSSFDDIRQPSSLLSPLRGFDSPINGMPLPMPMPPRTPLTAAKSATTTTKSATKSWSTPFSPLFNIENKSCGSSSNTPYSAQRFTNTISDDLIPHCKDFLEKQGKTIDKAKIDVQDLLDRFDNFNN